MTCDEAEILLHALIDGELDAGHARAVEDHIAGCPRCAAQLHAYRELSKAVAGADLRYAAPPELRRRIEASLPQARVPNRRAVLRGFAMGSAVSAIAATGLVAIIVRGDDEARIESEVVSAHLRSLQAGHLTDVLSTDQHTVKPWFAGHADVSPVVADFAPRGYRLVGGRADYFDHQRAAVVVYEHGAHVINVFTWVAGRRTFPDLTTRSGYHIAFWKVGNLQYCAVSDAGWEELLGLVRLLRDLGARDALQ